MRVTHTYANAPRCCRLRKLFVTIAIKQKCEKKPKDPKQTKRGHVIQISFGGLLMLLNEAQRQ